MYTFPPLQESDDLNEVYRLFGIAAHHCSNIEYRLVIFLLEPMSLSSIRLTRKKIKTVKERVDEAQKAQKQIDEVFNELCGMTIGQLIRQIKKHYNLNKDIEKYLRKILDKRNYLMHHFYASYGTKMHLKKTLKKMQQELKNIIDCLQEASLRLDKQVSDHLARRGLLVPARKMLYDMLGLNDLLESDTREHPHR
jgi:AraC-like DNA-binding protein